jgi:hypothetical protein
MRSYAGTAPLYASFPAHWLTGDRAILCTCRICSDPEFTHSVRQRYDALSTMMTPGALLTPTSSPSSYPPSTPSTLPGISQSRHHGHHSLDSVAEIVVAAASATMPNVVRDDWHRGRPERAIYSKESAMVRLYQFSIDRLPTFFLSLSSFCWHRLARCAASLRCTYISLACNASSHSPTASRGIPSLSTRLPHPSPCVHRAHSTLHIARN